MQFYDKEQIYKKLKKYYDSGKIFRSFIENSSLFPLEISLKKVQQKDIQSEYLLFTKELKQLQESNLPLSYKEYNFKTLGVQRLPNSVKIERLEIFLSLIDREKEYALFVTNYQKIISNYATLEALFFHKPMLVLTYIDDWEKFFLIIDFFSLNKQKDKYIREISLKNIDTKYIEKHKKILDILLSNILQKEPLSSISDFTFEKKYQLKYPQPQVRFRILDKDLYINGCSDITLCIDEFEQLDIACREVYIVENKITTLSFPDKESSIVIFGSGYKVGVLKSVKFLRDKEIYYWGDIDRDGFAILSQIRGYFPQICSILMDKKTLELFKHFILEYEKSSIKNLKYLHKDELELYHILGNERLEQEKIPFEYVDNILNHL